MKGREAANNLFQKRYSIANPSDFVFNETMRIYKEPLLHFLLFGALLFGVYFLMNRSGPAEGLVITAETMKNLEARFVRDWNRTPDEEERQELVDDYIREELAVREGRELGLDRNDPVVRQRLRQKLELMVEEEADVQEPTDQELAAYLREHADLFCDENGKLPELGEIRNLVIFEWENQLRLKQLDQFYQELESRYHVQVEF
ncbi:hypothetical protein [Pontiella agarivorans]|uniref:Uncharacterized protein n=1 Tax=Pontiella agarivorans TaxID=3038953 RepID=A0ABU5MUU3_9BACT|nr:hypothetical protein [Pontiella agarivorans]MDZ8117989.1 hypothetical protein [Pontiella agarivorans]